VAHPVSGRAANDAKRGSSPKSAIPIAWTSARKNFSLAQAIAMWPSAVAKSWNGTMLGCAEYGSRVVSIPADNHQVA
jgi:hypothetical protein